MKLMVIHGEYSPSELELRRNWVLEAASPETQVTFDHISGNVPESVRSISSELLSMLAGPQVVKKAQEAQEGGFDAVLPYGGLDLGVEAARYEVDIPVVGMFRNGFCLAAHLATRIAVIIYDSSMIPDTWKYIRQIGLTDFVTSIRGADIRLKDMNAQRDLVKERLVELGRQAVAEEDAEIILPRGTTFVPTQRLANEVGDELGVPVISLVAAGVKTAEMLVSLGLHNSRMAYPAPLR